jgi:hypothetical protein
MRPSRWRRATRFLLLARRRENFEAQGSGDRRGFGELNRDGIAKAIGRAGPVTRHGMLGGLEAEILGPEGRGGDEARRTGLGERHEEAGAGDAAYPRLELGADPVGEMAAPISASEATVTEEGSPSLPRPSARIRPRCTTRSA